MERLNNLEGVEVSKQLIDKNYTKGIFITPKYIVVHDTNNKDFGANAKFNRDYLSVAKVKSSAHYLVDERRIIQVLEDNWRGWHVSDGNTGKVSNSNSIAIRLCINRDNDFDKTAINAFYLIKALMEKYNISEENVKRHYDITGKICPRPMVEENPGLWMSIKEALRRGEAEEVQILNPLFYGQITNILTSLNIKDKDDRRSDVIGSIERGQKFAIYEELDEWYKIICSKEGDISFGYVSRNYVDRIKLIQSKRKKGFTGVIKTSIIREELEKEELQEKQEEQEEQEIQEFNEVEEISNVQQENKETYYNYNEVVEIVEVQEEVNIDRQINRESTRTIEIGNRDGLSSDIVKKMAMKSIENKVEERVNDYVGVVYNVITNLPIRKGPAPHFYVIGYLFPNDKVRIIEEVDGWYRIEYQSSKGIREGFVEKLYIRII